MSKSATNSSAPHSLSERFQIGASLIPPIALMWIGSRSGWIPISSRACLTAMPVAVLIGMLLPQVFSGWHRFFTAVQGWLGHRLLAGLLAVAFLVAVVPFGLWMRTRKRSFLEPTSHDSYWVPARPPGSLKNQF